MQKFLLTAAALILAPGAALAQSSTDTRQFDVIGTVPALCSGGTLVGGNGTFDLGVLIDTTTGLLRSDLSAPPKVLAGSFCSARSTINITATAMTAQNYAGPAPAGFAQNVDYTATASGWTATPAATNTALSVNPGATQSRSTAFTGDITVALSNFATRGGNALRLVADPSYRGLVTVTLTAAD